MTYYVYILTSQNNKVMYVGVTNNIKRRLYEHRNGILKGFTKEYNVHKLVYLEQFPYSINAIEREKQIKGWKREMKNKLVETQNPMWEDLGMKWELVGK